MNKTYLVIICIGIIGIIGIISVLAIKRVHMPKQNLPKDEQSRSIKGTEQNKTILEQIAQSQYPLHDLVVYPGVAEEVKQLLKKGADVHRQNKEGNTPLHLAAGPDLADGQIFSTPTGKIYDPTREVETISMRDVNVVKALLGYTMDVDTKNNAGETPIYRAIGYGYFDIVELLLEEGAADVNVQDNDGDTPLHLAALSNKEDIVELLLPRAKTTIKNNYGETPFDIAQRLGYTKIAELLKSAFLCATIGHVPLIAIDMAAGLTDQQMDDVYDSSRHTECRKTEAGRVAEVQAILKNNPSDNMPYYLLLPLGLASKQGDAQIVDILLKAGADVNMKDCHGRTALLAAAESSYTTEAIQVLLNAGADVNVQDKKGQTALMKLATTYKGQPSIQLLLKAGADVALKDKEGKTALRLAEEKGYPENAKLLKSAGAKE